MKWEEKKKLFEKEKRERQEKEKKDKITSEREVKDIVIRKECVICKSDR